MNFSTFRRICSLFLLILFLSVVGCENGEPPLELEETVQETKTESDVENPEPSAEATTIAFFSAMDPGQFDEVVRKPLNEAFPEITFELIPGRRAEEMLENWETITKPDLVLDFVSRLPLYENAETLKDLEPLVRKHALELEKFNENLIPKSSDGFLLGLPYNITSYGIIYNQSIFDHFQVDAPRDGMTWDELVELAKKVTGEVNGEPVQGFHLGDYSVLATQWSTDLYDPYTLETSVNTPAWKAIAHVLQGLYADTPDAQIDRERLFLYEATRFNNGELAMSIMEPLAMMQMKPEWDMAAFPTFPENPRIGPNYMNRYFLGVTNETQNADQVFEIVTHLLSTGYQLENSRNGWITALNDADVQAAYGQNIPELRDKNLQALFYNEPGELVPILDVSQWREVHTFARGIMTEIALGEKEVDQGLAYLEEKINEMID